MKSLVFTVVLSALAHPALAERNDYNPYQNYGQQEALRNSQYQNQQYVERLIRREIERRKSQQRQAKSRRSSTANCGKSFWTKREALSFCPPATAMKIRQNGEVFYHCDCE